MSLATEYASAASGTSWTNPTNANADDAAYATYTIAAKNTTGNVNTLSNFGFDSSIPSGATINSVTLEVEHKVSTTGGIAFLESALAISGTPGTYNSDSAEPTTDTQRIYSAMARPGGGSWTRADLLDGTFTVLLRARSGNNATSVTYSWDYARVVVDYTATATGSLAATESGADTAAASGTVLVKGALAATESGSDTFSGPGDVLVLGALAASETGGDAFAADGDVIVQGGLAAAESGADAFAASGTVGASGISGSLAATETGTDTAAVSGKVIVAGALAATEAGSDAFAATGTVLVKGALAATESGGDSFAGAGDVLVQGALVVAETGIDAFAASSGLPEISGSLDATESGADTAAATGQGSFAAIDGGVSMEIFGRPPMGHRPFRRPRPLAPKIAGPVPVEDTEALLLAGVI